MHTDMVSFLLIQARYLHNIYRATTISSLNWMLSYFDPVLSKTTSMRQAYLVLILFLPPSLFRFLNSFPSSLLSFCSMFLLCCCLVFRLAGNLRPSCLSTLSAGLTNVAHCIQLFSTHED